MESSKATDPTIRLYKELREQHKNVGIVIQAYLKRSEQDILNLPKILILGYVKVFTMKMKISHLKHMRKLMKTFYD